MSAKRIIRSGLVAALTLAVPFAATAARAFEDKDIKLSGCLVKGDEGGGYLLTNSRADAALQSSTAGNVAPSSVGTAAGFSTVFYWLQDHDDLENHVGHQVEIEGDLKGDLKQGEVKVDRKDKWTELTVRADGKTMKARVPHTSVVAAPKNGGDRKGDILFRRVDVGRIRMLGASCEP